MIHVEALERALLDGVKVDGVPLDDVLDMLDMLDMPDMPETPGMPDAPDMPDAPGHGGGRADRRSIGDRVRVDLGLIPVFSDERPLLGLAGLIDWRGSGRLSGLIRSGFCTATVGEQLLVPCDRRLPVERLVLVGLGARASFDDAQARAVARQLVQISTGLQARTVLIALPTQGIDRALAEALFEALLIEIEQLAAKPDPASGPNPIAAAAPSGDPPTVSDGDPGEEPSTDAAGDASGDASGDPSGDPSADPSADGGSDSDSPDSPSSPPAVDAALASPDPAPDLDVTTARWWVAVDQAVVARLRRVLSGPPRAARGGSSLHT